MRVETAIKMIENHGHKAFVTAEGLACVSLAGNGGAKYPDAAFAEGDVWWEEITTFETDNEYGQMIVCVDDIRNWLGY